MKVNETIISGIICGLTFSLIVLVGVMLINRTGKEYWLAVGFCLDKEGLYNISDYGPDLIEYASEGGCAYEVNCSNKKNPLRGFAMV